MISLGCFLITSRIGAFSILLVSRSFWNTGVSRMPSRIHRPIPTRMIDSANGTRQPQTRNSSPDHALKTATAKVDNRSPQGTPNCGHEATRPRWPCVRDHSIASSTEPPHSPPTPMPWIARSTVSSTAPQMPIDA